MGKQIHDPVRFIEQKYHIQLHLHSKPDEYAGPCPLGCNGAGEDRFHVWTKGNFWCRQCGAKGFVDELADNYDPPSEEELLKRRVERLEQKQREQEQRLRKLEEMHNCTDHLLYHRNLTENHKEYWYSEGIFDNAIESYQLGYASKCPMAPYSPSYTIPVYNIDNQLCNIRHRLVDESAGKYRPHKPGLGQQLFNAPILNNSHERLILCEGEKKSIILSQAGFPSVGIMGKRGWKKKWFDWFDVGRIYIALDPDADESAQRLGEIFFKHGFNDVRVADFPMKPDDFIYQYSANSNQIERILKWARPIH